MLHQSAEAINAIKHPRPQSDTLVVPACLPQKKHLETNIFIATSSSPLVFSPNPPPPSALPTMCSSSVLPPTTAATLLVLVCCSSSSPKLAALAQQPHAHQQQPRPAHQLVREGPFRLRLHYESDYNWQQDNLQFGTSYCWACSGSGADLGSSTTQATKVLEKGGDGSQLDDAKKQCQKGDTVWIVPCDTADPKQLFQYERIENLLQVDGHTSTVGLFKIAGTDLCLTDDRAENCGFDTTDVEYEEEKCYTLQKCATARYVSKMERAGGGGDGGEENSSSIISAATAAEEEEEEEASPSSGGGPYSFLPSIASRQLFVGFDPSRDLFEVHPFSLTGYTATQGISYRKCVSNHHHPKPRELIYAQGCDVARRTDSSYWKIWGESCTSYAPCHMCEGKCRNHDQCEGSLQCFYREDDADDSFISGCGSSLNGLEPGRNVCYYPGEGLTLTTKDDSDSVTTASLYECEGDCDADSDCFGELMCFFRNAYEPVPGCSGQGGRGDDYCYHPMRHGFEGESNMIPRITRSPTQAPTTAKPTPRPTLRARPDEPGRPRAYAMNDDKHSSDDSGTSINRAHTEPFGDSESPLGVGEGMGIADGSQNPSFEVVRNHNCFIRQCKLCEGSCQDDSDCADGLFCIKRDEFGDDIDKLSDCAGEARGRVNYCYHSRPYAELTIVPDAGANCGKGILCLACYGDCDNDDECAGNLKCFQRSSFERVPGCAGKGVEGRDYCYKSDEEEDQDEDNDGTDIDEGLPGADIDEGLPETGLTLSPLIDDVEAIDDGLAHEKLPKLTEEHYYCQKFGNCGVCEGDCNDSSQCSGDLVCIHREANESMEKLGCSGDGMRGMDYCVDQMRVNWRTARYDGTTKKWWAVP